VSGEERRRRAECEESGAAEINVGAKLGWPPAMITASRRHIASSRNRKRARRPKLRRGAKGRGDRRSRGRFARFARGYQTDDGAPRRPSSLEKEARETKLRVTRRGQNDRFERVQRT